MQSRTIWTLLAALLATSAAGAQLFADVVDAGFGATTRRSMATGDVNRDGIPDLVVVNTDTSVELYYGQGDGRFQRASARQWPALRATTAIRKAQLFDVDGDGDLDALILGGPSVFASRGSALRINDGRGQFTDVSATQLPPATTERPGDSVIVDVDGDGDLDVMMSSLAIFGKRPVLWTNDGTGRFSSGLVPFPYAPDVVTDWQLADVDGDGDEDMFSFRSSSMLLLNEGKSGWRSAPSSQWPKPSIFTGRVLDFDLDGDLDVVSLSARAAYRNDKGVFRLDTSVSIPQLSIPVAAELLSADVNGDRWPDLVVIDGRSERAHYLQNMSGRGFQDQSTQLGPARVASTGLLHDFDNDGDTDFVRIRKGALALASNVTTQLSVPALASVGATFAFDAYVTARAAATSFLPWVSGTRMPVVARVPGLGVLAVDPSRSVVLPPITVAASRRNARVVLPVPNRANLRGARLWFQAFVAPDRRLSNPTSVLLR